MSRRAAARALLLAAAFAAQACEEGGDYYTTIDFVPDYGGEGGPDTLPDFSGETAPDPATDATPDPPVDAAPDLPVDAPADPAVDPPADDAGVEEGGGGTCYSEPVFPGADLSDLERGYSGANALRTMIEALRRRWPAGADLLDEMSGDPYLGTFIDRSSFSTVLESAMTEVHEATHGWDYENAAWGSTFAYWLRADLTYDLPWVDGFPRSELYGMLADDSTSLYAGTYLTGEQGTRGFSELLDEMNCYINGLGGVSFTADRISGYGFSGIDGAVAFFYYLELYLKRARTSYPSLYAQLKGDARIVDFVRTQWLRLHFFLAYADRYPLLGVRDDAIRVHLYDPANEAEIESFIGAAVDASPCLP